MGHGLEIDLGDEDWPPGTFDFGFEDNITELIEDLLNESSDLDDISDFTEPDGPTRLPQRTVFTPGSPEHTREKRYTPRAGPWCGHETILRSWASAASSPKCQDCGRAARCFWTCTADTPDHSPFVPNPEPISRDISILPLWTQQAIARGEYTEAQLEKLLDQKVKVLELAASERRRVAQQEDKKPAESPEAAAASLVEAIVNRQKVAKDNDSASDEVNTPSPQITLSEAVICRLRVCIKCRPRYIEQAWGCINAIVNTPYEAPPQIPEYLDRPISNAAALRSMHEHCRNWNWSPDFQQWWEKVRFIGGYDLLPLLLMAEMIGANQPDFLNFVAQIVLRHRMSHWEMCHCLYWLNPQAFARLAPFLSAGVYFPPSAQLSPVVESESQPLGEETENQT
ncbi:hypothetical protein PENSUB_2476 [Penicillium subrubescens]|uniref:Uncharacterized protein n=2 Tax=Penicillium subrubescens TaxID=1316194 RepID=A0A1Q5UHI7_9EURO|nr:hypothetical protein PENSUB_2476 [Penicillium subrubescens]